MSDKLLNPKLPLPSNHEGMFYLALSEIDGRHPRIIELDAEYGGVTPYRVQPSGHLSQDALFSLMTLCPIVCRRTGSKIYCVGNSRMYQVALECLDPNQRIPVKEVEHRRLIEIDRLYWSEKLLFPIIFDVGKPRYQWLFNMLKKFQKLFSGLWSQSPFQSVLTTRHFAKLLKIDVRIFK